MTILFAAMIHSLGINKVTNARMQPVYISLCFLMETCCVMIVQFGRTYRYNVADRICPRSLARLNLHPYFNIVTSETHSLHFGQGDTFLGGDGLLVV